MVVCFLSEVAFATLSTYENSHRFRVCHDVVSLLIVFSWGTYHTIDSWRNWASVLIGFLFPSPSHTGQLCSLPVPILGWSTEITLNRLGRKDCGYPFAFICLRVLALVIFRASAFCALLVLVWKKLGLQGSQGPVDVCPCVARGWLLHLFIFSFVYFSFFSPFSFGSFLLCLIYSLIYYMSALSTCTPACQKGA